MMTRERPWLPPPSLAKTAKKIVEVAISAIPRTVSRIPKALPCSTLGAQFLVALIIDAQKVRPVVMPQKAWTIMDIWYEGKEAK
jgi:hypothetical protein